MKIQPFTPPSSETNVCPSPIESTRSGSCISPMFKRFVLTFFSCFCQTCCCQTPLRYCKSYQKIISTNEELISGRSGLVHVSTEHGSHAQSEGLYWSSRWLRYSKTPNFVDSLKFSFTNRTDGYFISVPPSIVDTRSSTDLVVREKEKVKHITHQPSYIANNW